MRAPQPSEARAVMMQSLVETCGISPFSRADLGRAYGGMVIVHFGVARRR
jgi:hypothetical protein